MIKKVFIMLNIIILFVSCITRKESIKKFDAERDRLDSIERIDNKYKSEKYVWRVGYDTLGYDSLFICYYSNGEVREKLIYKDDQNIPLKEEYYFNGQLCTKGYFSKPFYINTYDIKYRYDIEGNTSCVDFIDTLNGNIYIYTGAYFYEELFKIHIYNHIPERSYGNPFREYNITEKRYNPFIKYIVGDNTILDECEDELLKMFFDKVYPTVKHQIKIKKHKKWYYFHVKEIKE